MKTRRRILFNLVVWLLLSISEAAPVRNTTTIARRPTNAGPKLLEQRLPTAIIMGVKKSGTRALLEFLKINKRVKSPGPEVHFFDKNWSRGVDWYRQRMPRTTRDQITIEKSPSYFVSKDAPARLHKLMPDVSLILVVRNPITRAISEFAQSDEKRKRKRSLRQPTFEELATVQCAADTNTSACQDGRMINSHWAAVRTSEFDRHLQKWLEHFNRSQIYFVDGENLIRNPADEVAGVERFLGLASVVKPSHFVLDTTKGFPCVLRQGSSRPHCLGATKGRPHPSVDPGVLHLLDQHFDKHSKRFFALANRVFAW